jgi:transcriptional regulator with XRE-family HTH domain
VKKMKSLKELRKRNNLSQEQLGKLTGLSKSTISLYENGLHEPDLATLKRFADIFDVSLDVLLDRPNTEEREEDDMSALREQYRRDPNTRLLFQAARKATPDHIRAAAAMLKSLEPEEFPDVD